MKCCDCKIEKSPDLFYKNQKRCKDCTSIRNKKFRERNPNYNKKGGKGYSYDKINDVKAHNQARYKKYKHNYLAYNKISRDTPRGALYSILEALRARSAKQNYKPDFDLDYLCSLFELQEGRCAMTGIEFNFSSSSRIKRYRPFSVSIDRIDSTGKYEKKNIRLVCVAFNLALNAFGEDVFEKISVGYLKSKGRI